MMKNIVFPTIITLLLTCWSGMLYGADLTSHSAYKITSYNLGAIQNFQKNGVSNPATDSRPLFVTDAAAEALNSGQLKSATPGETPSVNTLNLNSIALSAQYDATSKISVQGAFGLTRNLYTPDLFDNMKGSSWEANLGIVYKLLDNISYELHFGYMETGDLFTNQSSYSDVESIIMVSNKLTLSW